MKNYILVHTPTQAQQRDNKGKLVNYSSDFDAMVALVAWAKETGLPAHDFLVTEYAPDNTKFAWNPDRKKTH